MASTSSTTERRNFLRIRYAPGQGSPRLTILSEEFSLIDAGEQSIRLSCDQPGRFRLNEYVRGTLVFQGGLMLPIDGTVLRKDDKSLVIILRQRIPRDILLSIGTDRRTCYRLRYPLQSRPSCSVDLRQWKVSEISEYGLRIRHHAPGDFMPGQSIHAAMMLQSGEFLEITGLVVRIDHDETVIALKEGISGKIVMEEQRRLLTYLKSAC